MCWAPLNTYWEILDLNWGGFDIRGRFTSGNWSFRRASKTPTRQKKSPNCADDAPVRGARAPRTGASSAQLGLLFSFDGVFDASLKIAPFQAFVDAPPEPSLSAAGVL